MTSTRSLFAEEDGYLRAALFIDRGLDRDLGAALGPQYDAQLSELAGVAVRVGPGVAAWTAPQPLECSRLPVIGPRTLCTDVQPPALSWVQKKPAVMRTSASAA
jgi:hypothetical protein